jgi:hypothetical protein
MIVDTQEFEALTERVDTLERQLRDIDVLAHVMRKAGMPDELREVADRESARRGRHLRVVE